MRHQTRWLMLGFASLAWVLVAGSTNAGPRRDAAAPPAPALASSPQSPAYPKLRLPKPVTVPLSGRDQFQVPPPNDKCSGAITIPCGNIALSGNTFGAINDYDFSDTTRSCTTYSAGGRDIVYKFNANAGDSVWLDYESSGDASFYILTDCSRTLDSCKVGADEGHQGEVEHIRYGFKRTTTYYLILDSYGLDTEGTWTLVGQFFSCGFSAPSNDRCEAAPLIYCGSFLYSGNTVGGVNDYAFPSLGASCANSLARGRDVAFRLGVTAGDSISVSYTSTSDAVLYIMPTCPTTGGTVSCNVGSNVTGVNGTETIQYRFIYTGTYYLVLDSDGLNTDGSWTLSGTLTCGLNVPSNDQCATAAYLPCGPFGFSGDNSLALPDYDPGDTLTCTGFAAVGTDVVYRIDASPGDSLWCDYVFPHVNGRPDVDASIYLLAGSCDFPDQTCVAGADAVGSAQMERLRYKFTTRNTYYLVLDSYESGVYGNWSAVGAQICPLALGVGSPPPAAQVSIESAVPNPFETGSTLRFTLPTRARATLRIHDLAGRVIRTLLDAEIDGGTRSLTWDARDDRGMRVPGGTYFARFMVGDHVSHRTLILIH
jgi:hypothetical protein